MAEYINVTPQTLTTAGGIAFNDTVVSGGCLVRHRVGSSTFSLKGGTCCNPYRFRIQFHGNVTGLASAMQLGVYCDGELLPETLMSVVGASVTDVLSVDAMTDVVTEDTTKISVRTITDGVTVNTAEIMITRVA